MKHYLPILAVAALTSAVCQSCYKSDASHSHLSMTEAFADRYKGFRQDSSVNARNGIPVDTVVFITGVEFDEGYDWRRDSLYDNAEGRIFLIRSGERVLEIEAGNDAHASTSPDKHHLVEGHVFTEFCDASGTYIGKDGVELFSFPGREVLRGLVVDGENVFTLGQGLDGQGLALRRNGEILFSRKDGVISGQMLDDSDYPTGALYMDCGHMYFSYWRPETAGSAGKAWYIVEDGRETQFYAGSDGLFDIRVTEGRVMAEPSSAKQSIFSRFSEDCMVIGYQDGTLMIAAPCLQNAVFTKETYYYFSFRNSCMCGNSLYIALTPRGEGKTPCLWKNGAVYELDINGFLTGVSVSVLPRESS